VSETSEQVRGQVLHVDRFGNMITNLSLSPELGENWACRIGNRDVGRLRQSYSDVKRGQWLAYLGSSGLLEIAVRDGSALDSGARRDDEVLLWRIG
jgi:S-adenosylmethionine hydrolase